ncbi:MAG: asparagine synthase (glutamine-hydrolyzing), partial [Nitrospirota bacterium]
GPDGKGHYENGRVGLAHTRLAIIDLIGGAQPLYNEDRSLALVANGEIYNYLELRRELQDLGHRFSTHSDCETILHAYEAWGERFAEHLHGMFAFALHDTHRDELILARDRLGIKPLYFASADRGFAFASELKALLPFLGTPQVDPAGLAEYLQNGWESAPRTLIRGVQKLMPGSIVRIGATGDLFSHRYWSPTAVRPAAWGLAEALERFDAVMQEVIEVHLRSDVPVGLFLSGGVDSSVLAALIAPRMAEPLRTFSVGFPGSSVDSELGAAAEVASRFGTQHTPLEVTVDAMLERLPHAVWAADDLMADYANLPVSLLAEVAGEQLKVVFSGEGGDEVFAGYIRYRQPWHKRLATWLRYPGAGGFRPHGTFHKLPASLYQPDLSRAMHGSRAPFIRAWRETPHGWTDLMRRQYIDIMTWLPDQLLVKADRMLMAWGVEGRVPFLDHRVVEFGLALPDALKVHGGAGKRFLKLWAERLLPPEALWTPKKGFFVPLRDRLRGEWLERYAAVVPTSIGVRRWFDIPALERLIEVQRRTGKAAKPLMRVLIFALWHRLFVEGDGQIPPRQQDPLTFLQAG